MIQVTDPAFAQLRALVNEDSDATKGLRVFVENGGCAGMQYGMGLDHAKEGDEIVERDGLRVMVDPESAAFLRGATIDYANELAGSGFRIKNPNAARSCGCGTSFEPGSAETEAAAHQH